MEIEFRGARNEREVDAAYELAAKTFGPNYFAAVEVKRRVRRLEPLRDLSDAVVAVNGPEVIGFVRIVDRTVCLGGQTLKVGGITSVVIRPDYHGRGYGRSIMEAALDRSRARSDVLSIAFARRAVDGFYWRLGYVGIGSHPEMMLQLGSLNAPWRPVEIRRGFDDRVTDVYAAAYRDSYQDLVMSFCRDAAWWADVLLRFESRIHAEDFRTICTDEGPVGYVILKERRIIEAASLPGSRWAVMAAVLSGAAEAGDELWLELPLGHWAVRKARSLNHTLRVRCSWDGGHLARVIDHAAFCAALGSCQIDADRLVRIRQCRVEDHESARSVLLHWAGVHSTALDDNTDHDGAPCSLAILPSWSAVDEF